MSVMLAELDTIPCSKNELTAERMGQASTMTVSVRTSAVPRNCRRCWKLVQDRHNYRFSKVALGAYHWLRRLYQNHEEGEFGYMMLC